jgi:micrococcal nuclease
VPKRFFRAECAAAAAAVFIFMSLSAAAFERREAVISRVVDGDTVKLSSGEKIRFIGVDTPEYEPWKNFEEPYGREASEYTKKNLTGKTVELESDVDAYDKYGRRLVYVFLEDGTLYNERLVDEGYAEAKYYAPNGRYRDRLNKAERKARAAKKGVWSLDKSKARD